MLTRFCQCGAIKSGYKCDKCGRTKYTREQTTTERGYGADWQRLSTRIRTEQPLCFDCQERGLVTPATQVHHEIPISDNDALRLASENLVPLCNRCHEMRHERKTEPGR